MNELALIPFKIKAFLEIKDRQEKGIAEQAASYDLKKHRRDVIRLVKIISPDERVALHDSLKKDMRAFLDIISDQDINFSDLGWKGDNAKNEFINLIEEVYQLKI